VQLSARPASQKLHDQEVTVTARTDEPGRLPALRAEYDDVQAQLADPAVHGDQARARTLGRRFAELAPVVAAANELDEAHGNLEAARELAAEDPSFAAEAEAINERIAELEGRLRELLVPKDPNDGKDVILEVKAGEGGDESALFAGDLLRMYLRYAERQGWATEVLDDEPTDLGGIKSATVAIRSRRPDAAVWAKLKYEGGVHRVQRVPATESQGRIHTSAAGVLVLPEAEDVEIDIDPNDLRIDVFRSSGPGGQSVNTTDSAVRITHIPTGTVVSMQNEKSQLQNREAGLRVLRARLLAAAQEQADSAASDARRSQVRTVDRSERVRTYNFAENRISDHRVGFKAYNLDQVLDGALDDVIEALRRADTEAMLAGDE
jgi:peptide chain release factor 1